MEIARRTLRLGREKKSLPPAPSLKGGEVGGRMGERRGMGDRRGTRRNTAER